jgi:ABC-type multidrug transport system ATPase subunit
MEAGIGSERAAYVAGTGRAETAVETVHGPPLVPEHADVRDPHGLRDLRPSTRGLRSAQFRALLIKTYHYQRRQWCDSVCIFLMPFVFLLAAFILGKIVNSSITHKQVTAAEQNPRGGFAPTFFDPNLCAEYGSLGCELGPFLPAIDIAVGGVSVDVPLVFPYAGPASSATNLGRVNYAICNPLFSTSACEALAAAGPSVREGLFGNFTLLPFLYNGSDIYNVNDLLLKVFSNDTSNKRYQALVNSSKASPSYLNNIYGLSVESFGDGSSGREALLRQLYNVFYTSDRYAFPQYFGAYVISDTSSFPNISATVYYNNTNLNLPYQSLPLTVPANEFCYPDGNCQLIAGVSHLYDVVAKANGKLGVENLLRIVPKVKGIQSNFNFVQLVTAVLIGILLHFMIPSILRNLVMERESGIRQNMLIMGLRLPTYYVVTYLGFLLMYLLVMISTVIFGLAFRIPFFTLNTPLLYFATFLLWGLAMISFCMFLAPFFWEPSTALILGWTYVVVINFIGGQYIGNLFTYGASSATFLATFLLPSFSFFYSVYYAGGVNVAGVGIHVRSDNTTVPGVNLGMCAGNSLICYSYLYLAVEAIVLLLIGLYLDQVIPHRFQVRKHPLFFLGFKRRVASKVVIDEEKANTLTSKAAIDSSVQAEEEAAAAALAVPYDENAPSVCIHRLSVAYPGRPPFHAVRGLSLALRRDETFAIIGQNGSGKSTTMNCLTGLLDITSGDVRILGLEVPGDLNEIQLQMGVCPQFDVLWSDLTGEEHLYFYARLKNVPRAKIRYAVQDALESVRLDAPQVRHRLARKYSGGMRRRLSVAIALIGGSKLVILDEPSTGLDPQSRYDLWACIQQHRAGRTILLTTHSMEETERLADRVGIMCMGQMRAIGRPNELRLRLGQGYRLVLQTTLSRAVVAHERILEKLSSRAVLEATVGGQFVYMLPREDLQLSQVFDVMNAMQLSGIVTDWSVSQATLEDVFLRVTREAEREAEEHRDKWGL